ncbi:HNH endonuclease [Streptomyces sp. GMY02]|uniref:HNH endonuclease n=1 Tax=Streptomyces sp. GMY02 TaxID=1333528 RepID=UPI001C2C9DE3|nr:HNH endonuclease signature motif containing protein [Streptomyces sp. GMY02]QXE35911.1 HNH endonuclease [Streptomyces sp. GMY02]
MWKIDPPVHTAAFSYATCTSRIRNRELRERLDQAADEVAASAAKYESAAESSELYLLDQDELSVASLTGVEMIAIYKYRMAKKKAVGRFIYDELMLAAPDGRCPMCGQRTVSTLDHVLPKTLYPALSVTPLNLIPACSDCNHIKSDAIPVSAENEPIHPYYDDLDGDPWLHAAVVHTSPAAIVFSVAAPINWPDSLKNRVATHFRTFKLAPLYASQAAQELNSIKHYLIQLHARGGGDAVRQHLSGQANSRRMAYANSWQTATYTALADDAWFYQGGFAA